MNLLIDPVVLYPNFLSVLNALGENGGKPIKSAIWWPSGTVSPCEVRQDQNGGCYLSLPCNPGQHAYMYDVEQAMYENRYRLLRGTPIVQEKIATDYLAKPAIYVNFLPSMALPCKTGWWVDEYVDGGGNTLDVYVDDGDGIIKCRMDEYGKTWVLLMPT